MLDGAGRVTRRERVGGCNAASPSRTLTRSYSAPDLALHCGTMLRECIKTPSLHASLLEGPDGGLSKPLHDLMTAYVHDPNFEVSADAFDTLTAILTTHKPQVGSRRARCGGHRTGWPRSTLNTASAGVCMAEPGRRRRLLRPVRLAAVAPPLSSPALLLPPPALPAAATSSSSICTTGCSAQTTTCSSV